MSSSQAKLNSQAQDDQKLDRQHKRGGDVADTKMVQPKSHDDHGLQSVDVKHHHHELVDCKEYDDGSGDVTGKCYGMTQQAHHFRCVG
ncbi:hypothetical protein BVRB_9g221370 [Beta vulgaris subsp. vulgaris]|nr:hypothetical protein BVRB_9g221370 [Beta vulgaris subsp. vulgaris]